MKSTRDNLSLYHIRILFCCVVLALTGCGGSDNTATVTPENNNETPTPTPPSPEPTPTPLPDPNNQMSMLHAEGTKWVNSDGQQVLLKGVNLGNWLLQEFWMMGQSTDEVNDQCTLEKVFSDRFGTAEEKRLMKVFHDNWITERDWDLIADFGMNVVRVPFIYSLIEDEDNPYTLRPDAWHYLDLAIKEASKRNMYVILDLHGAVGSQGWEHHSGCAGLNEYWTTPDYQARTQWLWQQIALRYKDNGTVAAYGLLNEPWGTSEENLAAVMRDLTLSIREIDDKHMIILPGHSSGINGYGNPADFEMENVAFEMHFYPGFFGWSTPSYDVHRDWLNCGVNGNTGVCEWQQRLNALNTPFINGEFQPWAGMGELGAETARATFDTYASFNWASTAWAYKVLTNAGGQGNGTWGMVTNAGIGYEEKLVSANTWACAGWSSTFEDACDNNSVTFTPSEATTAYLVLKAGALDSVDISFDNLSLMVAGTDSELLSNGEFGSATGWTEWQVNGDPVLDYLYIDNHLVGASGPILRVTGNDVNGGVYQQVSLEAGLTYTFSGVFKDNGSSNAWAEIYLVTTEPVNGEDVTGTELLPKIDFYTATVDEIEALFTSFSTLEYDVHDALKTALTAESPSSLFSLPEPPTGLTLVEESELVTLNWQANTESDVVGYHVYRSTVPDSSYEIIAENIAATQFVDSQTITGNRYYVVAAVDGEDVSYHSEQVSTNLARITIPGKLEAENYSDMFGFQTEPTTDIGGGLNAGWTDTGDWLSYNVTVETTGTYIITYRVASEAGSEGFSLLLNDEVIEQQIIASTGGWQNWVDITSTVSLTQGEHTLKIQASGSAWNLNWMEFSAE